MGQPLAVTAAEIEAHCRLRRIPLRPEEAELIQRIDREYRRTQNEAAAAKVPTEDWDED